MDVNFLPSSQADVVAHQKTSWTRQRLPQKRLGWSVIALLRYFVVACWLAYCLFRFFWRRGNGAFTKIWIQSSSKRLQFGSARDCCSYDAETYCTRNSLLLLLLLFQLHRNVRSLDASLLTGCTELDVEFILFFSQQLTRIFQIGLKLVESFCSLLHLLRFFAWTTSKCVGCLFSPR